MSLARTTDFWQRLSRRSQSNLYFALMFLDRERREAFRDVYRFLRAADDEVDQGLPSAEARRRLAAWRRELDAVYTGHATHPFAQSLAAAVRRFQLSREYFDVVLDALEEDIEPRRFQTLPDLERWCEAMSSTLGYLSLELLDAKTPATMAYARDVGIALQLANILRDVSEDAARQHIYLPTDILAAAHITESDILAGHYKPAFAQVGRTLSERARTLVAQARERLDHEQSSRLLVPEIWADVYLALLDRLQLGQFDVFSQRPYLPRRRKLAIALWRFARVRRPRLRRLLFARPRRS